MVLIGSSQTCCSHPAHSSTGITGGYGCAQKDRAVLLPREINPNSNYPPESRGCFVHPSPWLDAAVAGWHLMAVLSTAEPVCETRLPGSSAEHLTVDVAGDMPGETPLCLLPPGPHSAHPWMEEPQLRAQQVQSWRCSVSYPSLHQPCKETH